jgi:hypothetical protein
MILLSLSAVALIAGGPLDSAGPTAKPANNPPILLAQITISRRTVIRVIPAQAATAQSPRLPPFKEWKEKDAPKCVTTSSLAGLMISKPDSIDLLLRGGQVMRAKLEKGCSSVDFYSGFYFQPTKDGRICQDRDTIHSRTGGACEIDKFKSLTPPK